MITEFNIGDNVITGYGKVGVIKSLLADKESFKYLIKHIDNTEAWHEEHDLNIIIGDEYLTE